MPDLFYDSTGKMDDCDEAEWHGFDGEKIRSGTEWKYHDPNFDCSTRNGDIDISAITDEENEVEGGEGGRAIEEEEEVLHHIYLLSSEYDTNCSSSSESSDSDSNSNSVIGKQMMKIIMLTVQ